MYLATYGFGFILFASILFIFLGMLWTNNNWSNLLIKSILVLAGIAGFIILFGK